MKYSSVRYCERKKKVKCRAGGGGGLTGGGGGHESVCISVIERVRNNES